MAPALPVFAGKPAPTRRPVSKPSTCVHQPICVGAGLPANTVVAATVNGGWKLASRAGPFAGKPAPTRRPVSNPRGVSTTNLRRSGFTRKYGSGGNSERRVEIGQQGRPFRG